MGGTQASVPPHPTLILTGTTMTEADKPKPALTLIDCDRTELERRLLHLACSDSSAEFKKAVDAFISRATLCVVEARADGVSEPKKEDSP